MKLALIALGALVASSTCAAASTWVKIVTTDNGTVLSLDLDSVRRVNKHVRKAWLKYDFVRTKTPDVVQTLYLLHVRCEDRTLSTARFVVFNAAGDANSTPTFADEYLDPTPDSYDAGVVDAVCAAKLR